MTAPKPGEAVMVTAAFEPADVRKAAAFVEKLDHALNEFGVRLVMDPKPIRFELIGSDGSTFEVIPVDDDDPTASTELRIGFLR